MIRYYFTALTLIAARAGYSQSTLVQTNGFLEGTFIHVYVDTAPVLNEGNDGADQTWDFSSLYDPNPATDYTALLPEYTPYGANFPDANISAMSINLAGEEVYHYYTNYLDNYTYWGYQSLSGDFIHSNPRDILHFPFGYGSNFSDTYHAPLLVGYFSGTVDVTADGSGTVILPTGTFMNCLRVREIRKDTTATSGLITSIDTTYKYYAENLPEPIVLVVHHHSSDGYSANVIHWQNVEPSGIAANIASGMLTLFPNPCTDVLQVTGPVHADATVYVYDISGRMVISTSAPLISSTMKLGTTGLADGVYFLSVKSDAAVFRNKFEVSRTK